MSIFFLTNPNPRKCKFHLGLQLFTFFQVIHDVVAVPKTLQNFFEFVFETAVLQRILRTFSEVRVRLRNLFFEVFYDLMSR